MNRQFAVLAVLMVCATVAFADESLPTDYTVAMVWSALDPGARPGALGRAYTALADDAEATYWNPGALGFLKKLEFTVTHEPRGVASNNEMFFDYGAFVYPTPWGTFALSLQYHNMGESDRTDEQGNFLGTMHSYGINPWFSYGKTFLDDKLGIGASVKYDYEHLFTGEGGTSSAICFDLAGQYRPFTWFRTGLAITNIGPTIDGSMLPRTMRIGVASNLIKDKFNDLNLSADVHKVMVNLHDSFTKELAQAAYCGGAEYFYFDLVGVRLGYYYLKYGDIMGLSFGAGVRYAGFSFDYANLPEGGFGEENRFTLNYRLP
jgi:hypothetical protein